MGRRALQGTGRRDLRRKRPGLDQRSPEASPVPVLGEEGSGGSSGEVSHPGWRGRAGCLVECSHA